MPSPIGSRALQLTAGEIDLWPVSIEAPEAIVARFFAFLSPDEVDRAQRFHFDYLQRSFTLSRGALRLLLGRYTGIHPGSIQFAYGSNGKPSLVAPKGVSFNLSHSGTVGLFAFALGREIGVDVEQIRPVPDMHEIARRFFCREETEDLMSLPQTEREQAFFLCWTRKEAYIKAVGAGLFTPLDSFRVAVRRDEPVRFVHFSGEATGLETWNLHDLRIGSGYAAALAYCGEPRVVRLHSLVQPAELLDV